MLTVPKSPIIDWRYIQGLPFQIASGPVLESSSTSNSETTNSYPASSVRCRIPFAFHKAELESLHDLDRGEQARPRRDGSGGSADIQVLHPCGCATQIDRSASLPGWTASTQSERCARTQCLVTSSGIISATGSTARLASSDGASPQVACEGRAGST